MRLFNKPPEKEKYFPANPVQHQVATYKLYVAHRNDQIIGTGRSTTIYRTTDETNGPVYAGSFYLLPDPYCESHISEDNHWDDSLSEEERMLYELPLVTYHSLYKI